MTKATPDIRLMDEGTIVLFKPLTMLGETWLADHTDGTWFGGALAVERRYAPDLVRGAVEEGGLTLEIEPYGMQIIGHKAANLEV